MEEEEVTPLLYTEIVEEMTVLDSAPALGQGCILHKIFEGLLVHKPDISYF